MQRQQRQARNTFAPMAQKAAIHAGKHMIEPMSCKFLKKKAT